MEQMNNEELEERIAAFIAKKDRQYPELALRGVDNHKRSLGYVITSKIFELVDDMRFARLAR